MDRITRSYLSEFRTEQALESVADEGVLFEYFAGYCVLSALHEEEFDVEDVHTGSGNDLGIDALAIIVNGVLIQTVDEAEDLLNINGFLDVKFVFAQAKTSSTFSGDQITTFLDGVLEFFAEQPSLPTNEAIDAAREVMTWLYEHSVKFKRSKPILELAFVSTGSWVDDQYLTAKIQKGTAALSATGLFEDVRFAPYGADEIQRAYQRSKNNVTVEFSFANKVLLPDITGVKEAYLGVIPASEYLRLITDPTGNIRKPLFYDNVRDFQGDNPVNAEIRDTLQATSGRQRFAVLNNGVTVVTRDLKTTGNKFLITDYQIVNGCQTSHVLFDSAEALGDDVHVPIKVISTSDEDIISSIITATNRQTEVTADDLFAMSSFQKKLEALYLAYPDKKQLFYERRSKQYASAVGIEKVRIIGKSLQVRAFAAMFLDESHRAARYYSELRAQVGSKIFVDEHKLEPYYASAYAYYKLEYLFRNGVLNAYYKPARFHLLMALRYIVGGVDMPALSANKVVGYTNTIVEALWDDEKAVDGFTKAIDAVDAALQGQPLTRDVVKTQGFTDLVKAAAIAAAGDVDVDVDGDATTTVAG